MKQWMLLGFIQPGIGNIDIGSRVAAKYQFECSAWILTSVQSRRRMGRERSGAEPSVLSIKTLYYKTIYHKCIKGKLKE